jgi:polysaccharide export outer membrane protein
VIKFKSLTWVAPVPARWIVERNVLFTRIKVIRELLRALLVLVALYGSSVSHAQQLPAYTLHPGDKINISVWKEPDLQRAVIIQPDGKFSFPLAGEINANGKTVAQVQADILTRLKVYMPEPVITVSVEEIDGNKIYVIGQVLKAGAFVMNPQLNVLQALTLAGGTTPYASLGDIIILRTSKAGQKILPFRYNEVIKGRSLGQNIPLESGDVVVVP